MCTKIVHNILIMPECIESCFKYVSTLSCNNPVWQTIPHSDPALPFLRQSFCRLAAGEQALSHCVKPISQLRFDYDEKRRSFFASVELEASARIFLDIWWLCCCTKSDIIISTIISTSDHFKSLNAQAG